MRRPRNARCPWTRPSRIAASRSAVAGRRVMKWIAVLGLVCAVSSVAIVERAVQARRAAADAPARLHPSSAVMPPASERMAPTAIFERNDGQAPAGYRYLARHAEHEFAFAPGVIAITVTDAAGASSVALRFDGGRAAEPAAEAPLANVLDGRSAGSSIRDVPTFERIRYANVYRGIDAVFYAVGSQVEYDLVVKPQVDPSSIALAFDGAASLRLDDVGDLVVGTDHGSIVQRKPAVYQTRGERRVPVPAAYRIDD